MATIDNLILVVAHSVALLLLAALWLFLIWWCLSYTYRIWRNLIGASIMDKALKDYRAANPDTFKRWDKIKVWWLL